MPYALYASPMIMLYYGFFANFIDSAGTHSLGNQICFPLLEGTGRTENRKEVISGTWHTQL
jgi:hypothetical protein